MEVWVGLGDSEMDGRGLITEAPADYPSNALYMCKDPIVGAVHLQEPLSTSFNRIGPLGLFGQERLNSVAPGTAVCVVPCAKGGTKSSEIMPGTPQFEVARARITKAIQVGPITGFILFNGLNDATLSSDPGWDANSAATLSALKAEFGDAPVYVVRYPATVPTDMAYPIHASLRASIGSASFADAIVDAPEGPWYEPTKLHLATDGNAIVAQRLADAVAGL